MEEMYVPEQNSKLLNFELTALHAEHQELKQRYLEDPNSGINVHNIIGDMESALVELQRRARGDGRRRRRKR